MNILQLKHWMVFILLFVSQLAMNFTWEHHVSESKLIHVFGFLIFWLWVVLTGREVYKRVPRRLKKSETMYFINAMNISLFFGLMSFFRPEGIEGNGFLLFLMVMYVPYAFFQVFSYSAKCLKTIEMNKTVGFRSYIGLFFLFLFLPIGIWIIQPKLNKVYKELNVDEL